VLQEWDRVRTDVVSIRSADTEAGLAPIALANPV
jgi:hypothetical protein